MPSQSIPYLALIPYAAIALGLILTLALFLSLKWEMQHSARRERKRVDQLLERLQAASTATSPEPVFVPAPMRPGFNINRRVHIQRLLRKGQDAAHIAAALGVPRAEVDLLIRVHKLSAGERSVPTAVPAVATE